METKYGKVVDNIIVYCSPHNDVDGLEIIPNDAYAGRVRSGDTFVLPPVDDGYCLRKLRRLRDQLIEETDWWASSDLTMTDEQTTYRQALRDLPATSSPSLDSKRQLTGVTWPTKPS